MEKRESKSAETITINQSNLVKEYALTYGTTQREATVAIESTIALLNKKLRIDKVNVSLQNFGKFYQKTLKPKRTKSFTTGEYFMSEPKDVVRFTQSNSF